MARSDPRKHDLVFSGQEFLPVLGIMLVGVSRSGVREGRVHYGVVDCGKDSMK